MAPHSFRPFICTQEVGSRTRSIQTRFPETTDRLALRRTGVVLRLLSDREL